MRLTGKSIFLLLCVCFATGTGVVFSRSSALNSSESLPPTPTPMPGFDQKASIGKLKEQIKGRESEPADKVFKSVTTPTLKSIPAGRLLAIMEFGYARSLGVDCTHCHVPEKWESEEKQSKQTTREMSTMVTKINGEMLKGIKNLASSAPTINCTTCHRGEIKPATDLPRPK